MDYNIGKRLYSSIIAVQEIKGRNRQIVETRSSGSRREILGGGGSGEWYGLSGMEWFAHRKIHATDWGLNYGFKLERGRGGRRLGVQFESHHSTSGQVGRWFWRQR